MGISFPKFTRPPSSTIETKTKTTSLTTSDNVVFPVTTLGTVDNDVPSFVSEKSTIPIKPTIPTTIIPIIPTTIPTATIISTTTMPVMTTTTMASLPKATLPSNTTSLMITITTARTSTSAS